jgi:ribonuclease HI
MTNKTGGIADLAKALAAIKKNGVDPVSIISQSQALYKMATEGYYVEKATSHGVETVREVNLAVAANILKLQSEQLKWLYDRVEGFSEDEAANKFNVNLTRAVPVVRSIK